MCIYGYVTYLRANAVRSGENSEMRLEKEEAGEKTGSAKRRSRDLFTKDDKHGREMYCFVIREEKKN